LPRRQGPLLGGRFARIAAYALAPREGCTVTTGNDAGYRRSLEVHDKIEALYPRIEQHAARFRGMTPADSRLPRPPGKTPGLRLDPMVCALAIKAATTKRAVFTLCELGDGDNAMALTRVLLENACLLEWLIRGQGRQRAGSVCDVHQRPA
jgi:uncharacterized protein DUF5677